MSPQPGRGTMWIVQAVEPPPQPILHTNHGEILISRRKAGPDVDKPDVAPPIASAATLALCGGGEPADDPWTKTDPWKMFRPSTTPVPASDSVHQLESRIQAAVLAKMPQSMEQDDLPDRLGLLEGQVHQLMQKQSQIETQFSDFSAHQTQTVAGLQNQMQVQSQQLFGQIETQNQSIQAMFENQLTHIRGLLAKRPREDGE